MNVHCVQHVPFEGPGSIERWAESRDHRLIPVRLFAGDPLPPPNDVDWLVVMGGPMNVRDERAYPWLTAEKSFIAETIAAHKVVLGVCLGAQLVAAVLGAAISRNAHKEIGWFPVELSPEARRSGLFGAVPASFDAFHWHGDTFDLPAGALHAARSEACAHQAFVYGERVVGLQFHLETTVTGARELVEHCADDITEGPYVQPAGVMLADERRFAAINKTMDALLDALAAVGFEQPR